MRAGVTRKLNAAEVTALAADLGVTASSNLHAWAYDSEALAERYAAVNRAENGHTVHGPQRWRDMWVNLVDVNAAMTAARRRQ